MNLWSAGYRWRLSNAIPLVYEKVRIDVAYRADLIVDDKVILELKSVEKLSPVHYKQ